MWNEVEDALHRSFSRVITGIANLLPGLVALILALLIAGGLAWVLGSVVRRSLKKVEFDERLANWGFAGIAEWSPSNSPTLLVAQVFSSLILLIGFLIGIAAFDATLTSRLAIQLFAYLPNVIAAVLVLLVGTVLARYLARSVLIGAVNMNLQYARLMGVGVKWLVLVLSATIALDHLGIGGKIIELAFGILFGGIVFALALAVGLGSKDIISRSLERQSTKPDPVEEPFRHL